MLNMKATIAILVFVTVGLAQSFITYEDVLEAEFLSYKKEYNKSYEDSFEEQLRKQIFKDNKMMIDKHNERYGTGEVTYLMGINQFTDMLATEFKEMMLSGLDLPDMDSGAEYTYLSDKGDLPDSIDWRQKGAVTEVKSQGQCGSCWAFSSTGALEGAHFIKTQKLVSLSEQNLVDCSKQTHGCQGGWPRFALHYIQSNGGIDLEEAYPYKGVDGKCRFNKDKVGATVANVAIVRRNEKALAHCVAEKGPVSVCVDASTFQHYSKGIFNDPSCRRQPNHAVLVVGYGSDHWLIKNSWSTTWGENGYMRLARNQNNLCQVANYGVLPIV